MRRGRGGPLDATIGFGYLIFGILALIAAVVRDGC
jgi:hypothetical protein